MEQPELVMKFLTVLGAPLILVKDKRENPVVLFTSQWEKDYCIKLNPNHKFIDVLV